MDNNKWVASTADNLHQRWDTAVLLPTVGSQKIIAGIGASWQADDAEAQGKHVITTVPYGSLPARYPVCHLQRFGEHGYGPTKIVAKFSGFVSPSTTDRIRKLHGGAAPTINAAARSARRLRDSDEPRIKAGYVALLQDDLLYLGIYLGYLPVVAACHMANLNQFSYLMGSTL